MLLSFQMELLFRSRSCAPVICNSAVSAGAHAATGEQWGFHDPLTRNQINIGFIIRILTINTKSRINIGFIIRALAINVISISNLGFGVIAEQKRDKNPRLRLGFLFGVYSALIPQPRLLMYTGLSEYPWGTGRYELKCLLRRIISWNDNKSTN